MNRVEENGIIINEMSKRVKCNPTGAYEEMITFQLGAISTMLADISKSLAIIADKVESDDEHMTADEFAELFAERDKEEING